MPLCCARFVSLRSCIAGGKSPIVTDAALQTLESQSVRSRASKRSTCTIKLCRYVYMLSSVTFISWPCLLLRSAARRCSCHLCRHRTAAALRLPACRSDRRCSCRPSSSCVCVRARYFCSVVSPFRLSSLASPVCELHHLRRGVRVVQTEEVTVVVLEPIQEPEVHEAA